MQGWRCEDCDLVFGKGPVGGRQADRAGQGNRGRPPPLLARCPMLGSRRTYLAWRNYVVCQEKTPYPDWHDYEVGAWHGVYIRTCVMDIYPRGQQQYCQINEVGMSTKYYDVRIKSLFTAPSWSCLGYVIPHISFT